MTEVADKIRQRLSISDSGCWLWQGAKVRKGYGVVLMPRQGRQTYTHRAMYEAAKGPIPDGFQIDHLCCTPACCNPDHLEAVTPAENTRRGRSREAARLRKGTAEKCCRGHAFTAENSYIDRRGNRSCKACRRIQNERWNELRKSRAYRTFTAAGDNIVALHGGKNG